MERCNYLNISQNGLGLFMVHSSKVDVLDSVFQKNQGTLFFANYLGRIYIIRCIIDQFSASSFTGAIVDNSSMATETFSNDLEFIGLDPCEVLLFMQAKEKKICSVDKCRFYIFGKHLVTFLLIHR